VSGDGIAALARQAGIAVEWTNAAGEPQEVASGALRPILEALGLPCDTPAGIAESQDRLVAARASRLPTMMTANAGMEILLPVDGGRRARITFEDGTQRDVALEARGPGRSALPAITQPGYHMLQLGDGAITLAVAPKRCFTVSDIAPDEKLWGLSVQLYGLRRPGDGGIGDTTALGMLAKAAARHRADAVALSPTHALFGAEPSKFSPYSPSNRLMLNPLVADPGCLFGPDRVAALDLAAERDRLESMPLVDWPAAAARKRGLLRRLFDDFWLRPQNDPEDALTKDFLDFRRSGADMLECHARFEALHAEQKTLDPQRASWRDWPADLRDPASAAIASFAAAHGREIVFHIFLQWVADRSLLAVQAEARSAGLRIGLIADLAVGMESGGSHAWARQSDLLAGLSIGAPPDLFNPKGQDWGLTTFSPRALVGRGFEPFLETLRAAMRHAGGARIDHAMGLTRLWVVPEGASPSEGAYLTYPLDDLLRLIRLESFRHRAIVIGEDLGTVPEGFREKLADAGIAGMDVLWFAREDDGFLPSRAWRRAAIAMTSTHDLPSVAGWWRGHDISLRESLGLLAGTLAKEEQRARAIDRKHLWRALRAARATSAAAPLPNNTGPVVDAATAFVAETPAPLVLIPLEDALGLEEQPNLPGTVSEHPNWRRRYPGAADKIFDDPAVAARASTLAKRGAQR
jgi:4-alpha-glucanotransferase